ncbi:hypothetical protein [Mesohalobacter halotolerans]|nr:hypothetical protein [Mesohalobacter halotolerans]
MAKSQLSKKDEIKDTYHWFLEYEGKFNQVNIDEENRMNTLNYYSK